MHVLKLKLKLCPRSTNQIQNDLEIQDENEVPDIEALVLTKLKSEIPNKNFTVLDVHKNFQEKEMKLSIFEKAKLLPPYNEILLSDAKYKDLYSEALYQAVFTFPKF